MILSASFQSIQANFAPNQITKIQSPEIQRTVDRNTAFISSFSMRYMYILSSSQLSCIFMFPSLMRLIKPTCMWPVSVAINSVFRPCRPSSHCSYFKDYPRTLIHTYCVPKHLGILDLKNIITLPLWGDFYCRTPLNPSLTQSYKHIGSQR